MREQRFETGKAPHVVVNECGGALVVGSWKDTAVLAQGSDFTANSPKPDQLEFSSSGDLTLTVPEKASLTIKTCAGQLTIKHVDGFVSIGTAVQAISLNDLGSVKISASGDRLTAENINGPLNIEQAQTVKLRNVGDVTVETAAGNVSVQFATGAVAVGKVNGRIILHTINGSVAIEQGSEVQLGNLGGLNQVKGIGDLWLVGGLVNGAHSFQAEGNIYAAWPPDAPITLVAEAAVIDNQLSLTNAAAAKLDDGRTQLTGHIEQGKPFVVLKTTGNIGLKPLRPGMKALSAADFDFTLPPPTLDDAVETAVTDAIPTATPTQIEQIADDIEEYLAAKAVIPPPGPSAGQIAAAKAQKKVEKSLAKAGDSIEGAKTRLAGPTPPKVDTPKPKLKGMPEKEAAKPTKETAVPPSQTQILKLLKDGLITVEQADVLLNQLPKD